MFIVVIVPRKSLDKACLPSADRVIVDVPNKLFLSVFLLHNFFSTIKIEENRTCCIGMDGSMSLGKIDCKIKKKK